MKISYLSIVFFLMFFGCKKIETPVKIKKPLYINDIDSLTNSFYFIKDSWWLYADSLNNITDSIYVQNTDTDSIRFYVGENCNTCGVDTSIYGGFMSIVKTIDFSYTGLSSFYGYYLFASTIRIGNSHFPFFMEGQPIFYSNDTNCFYQSNICYIQRLGFYTQMNVLNQPFYNVYHFKIDASKQLKPVFDFDTELYFAPHIGIIKKTEHDTINGDKVWLLKNYEVWQ